MTERLAQSIADKAKDPFNGMGNAPSGIDWIRDNQAEFEGPTIGALAEVVHKFNALIGDPNAPDDLVNIHYFKARGIKLPRLGELIAHYAANPEHFKAILAQAKQRMVRGDNNETKSEYYTFHKAPLSPKQMAVIETFEVIDMLYQQKVGFSEKHEGQLTCALIEALAEIGPENKLYLTVISTDPNIGANWVYGYEGFDLRFRNRIVGEPLEDASSPH